MKKRKKPLICLKYRDRIIFLLNINLRHGTADFAHEKWFDKIDGRENLPVLLPEGYKVGIWQILKSAIGKDITKISMPVELNEPISFL